MADGDDGIIELILDSNETVARLQGYLTQILRKQLQKLCQLRLRNLLVISNQEKRLPHKLGYQN